MASPTETQAEVLAGQIRAVLKDQDGELLGIDVRPESTEDTDLPAWIITTGVFDTEDDTERTFVTRVEHDGQVDAYEEH